MPLIVRPDFRTPHRSWYVFDNDAGVILRDGFSSQVQAEEWIKDDDPVLRATVRSAVRRVWMEHGRRGGHA